MLASLPVEFVLANSDELRKTLSALEWFLPVTASRSLDSLLPGCQVFDAERFLAANRLFQGLVANSPGLKYDRS